MTTCRRTFVRYPGTAAAGALVLALTLGGCAANDTKTTPDDSKTSAPDPAEPITAERMSSDDWWDASLCAGLDLDALSRDTNVAEWERARGSGFMLGVPPLRTCSIGDGTTHGQSLEFGVSVAPVTEEAWTAASAHVAQIDGGDVAAEHPDVGDEAIAVQSFAMARVDDRVITVDSMDVDALDAAHLAAALSAAVDAAEDYDAGPQQVIDECAAADEQAAAALGAQATIRLDFYSVSSVLPNCIWATETASTQSSAIRLEDAAEWENDPDQGYDQMIEVGLGGGLYLDEDDPTVVFLMSWAGLNDDHDATLEFLNTPSATPEIAIALTKGLEKLY